RAWCSVQGRACPSGKGIASCPPLRRSGAEIGETEPRVAQARGDAIGRGCEDVGRFGVGKPLDLDKQEGGCLVPGYAEHQAPTDDERIADGLAFLARMRLASSGKTADKLEKPCLRPTVPILGPVLAGRHGTGRADQFVGFLDTACQR